jgi:hypothetical protein
MATRGPNWSPTEHMILCRAFIATSEDPIVGTDQKGAEFQQKLHANYKQLLGEHNQEHRTHYHERKCTSNFNQFKKLSKAVLKYIGVEDNAGDPPSGDSDKAVWLESCREAFNERYSDMKNLLDSVLLCKDFLQQSPKWEAFEKKMEGNQKKKRPVGTKKAKQAKSDEKLVKRVLSVCTDEKAKKKHQKNKDDFMAKMSSGIDVMTRNMSDKNDQELLTLCSPRTQKTLAAELMRERIRRMQTERKSATIITGATTLSSLSCDADDDGEVGGVGRVSHSSVNNESVGQEQEQDGDESEESSYDDNLRKKVKGKNGKSTLVYSDSDNDDDEDLYG